MTYQLWSLILSSAILHALWNFGAKKVSGNLSTFWIGTWISCLFLAPFAFWELSSQWITAESGARILVNSLLNTAYILVLARAYRIGDLSFIYPIARGCGVALAAVAGRRILGETISPIGVAGIAAISLGTIVLSFHPSHRQKSQGELGLAILVGIILAACAVNDKGAMSCTSTVVYLFGMYLLTGLMLTPLLFRRHSEQCRKALRELKLYSLLIGLGSLTSYGLILLAFHLGPVIYIVPAKEFAVVVAAGLGFVFLREPFSFKKGVGIAVITFGLVLIKLA